MRVYATRPQNAQERVRAMNREDGMRENAPTYTDEDQGTDQDQDTRTPIGLRSVAYQQQQARTRGQLADELRLKNGTSGEGSAVLDAVDRRPLRPARGKPATA